jgi:hypothetical protein
MTMVWVAKKGGIVQLFFGAHGSDGTSDTQASWYTPVRSSTLREENTPQ